MRKLVPYIFIFILLIGILTPLSFSYAQNGTGVAQPETSNIGLISSSCGYICKGVLASIQEGYYIILQITAFFLWLSGMVLDKVLIITIIDFAKNIEKMTGIQTAWILVRDLMNLAFVFLLLYQGLRMILGRSNNAKNVIFGIVLASILINFSLFITKVVIDASNIVTVGFYNAIVESSQVVEINSVSDDINTSNFLKKGLSGAYVNALGVNTFYDKSSLEDIGLKQHGTLILVMAGGSILFLLVSVIFLVVAIMLLIRYAILIILMMLSPLAVMGIAIPRVQALQRRWWEALLGQSLFAPAYMIMTWIILTLISSEGFNPIATSGKNWSDLFVKGDVSSVGLIINFAIIIILTIISLAIAKEQSNRGGVKMSEWTSKATTFAGGAVLGGTAAALRASVGTAGRMAADNASLQKSALEDTGWRGARSRLALYASRTARDSSFDVRGAKIPTGALGDLVEGTVGRTRAGKAIGLDEVNIPSIDIGTPLSKLGGLGTAGTKGHKELRDEKEKRIRDRNAANTNELSLAQAKDDIIKGSKVGATVDEIDAMEKALSKLSDKQTETLVSNNRELLKSLNFANSISVKQLEAINKSDLYSEDDTSKLKERRFEQIKTIYDPRALAEYTRASAVPIATRTAVDIAAIKQMDDARARVKGLSDSELEMQDPSYFDPTRPEGREFISQLRSAQAESIITNKGGKYSTAQKNAVKTEKIKPLMNAISSGVAADVRREIKKVNSKTMVGYMKTPGPTPGGPNIGLENLVLDTYDIQTLRRMAAEENMTPGDVSTLRTALIGDVSRGLIGRLPIGNPVRNWLEDPDKGVIEFPA